MTGRILIVDSVPTNRIVLRVKLAAAFYDVVQASSGTAALASLGQNRPDLVIAAAALPDMTGRDFCAELKMHPMGHRVPVILIHNGADPEERLASLAAGADDILPRPVDDLVLLARLRSLLRARDAEAELELRDDTQRALGLGEEAGRYETPALIALVPPHGDVESAETLVAALRTRLSDRVIALAPDTALKARPVPDVFVLIEPECGDGEALALLPQLRANTESRHASLMYVARPHQRRAAAAALDMGANDLLAEGPDPEELALRLRKQVARKQMVDRLRATMRDGLRAAVTDPLTGLYNRRYTLPYIARVAERAKRTERPYALLLADLDHFKQVNDLYGHAAGDIVLQSIALRIRDNLRAADLVARYGGEEFLAVMPDTTAEAAYQTASRLCRTIAATPVMLPDGRGVRVTLSVGVTIGVPGDTTPPTTLIEGADRALYAAKDAGRTTVVMADRIAALPRRPRSPSSLPGAEEAGTLRQMTGR